ncbi:MAG: restriction endonuclease subunit R [Blastopirellula sp.]|nr:MAG: restriction endonuclease subunit R [Blastopirellula sp.]
MILRPYQDRLMDGARMALRRSRSILIQSPTGSGKTALTVAMMSRAASRGLSSFFCVHQKELLKQTSQALWEQRLEHGMIAAGKRNSIMPCQVASVQTLVRRLDQYKEPAMIIIDEAHRAAAATYMKILEHYPNAKIIGLTATPERTDGKGLGHLFQEIVEGPSIRELIDAGYLCDYDLFAPPTETNLDEIRNISESDTAQLEQAIDKPSITGDAVEHYIKHASGKRCVVMCVSVNHAKHVAAQYRTQGIPAEAIYGDMADADRDGCFSRFKKGETLILTNVQLLVEGVDIPSIEVIQWLRPTESLIIWMQGNGRGFRIFDGKGNLIIFDHVGNWKRHGLPDDDREWTLEGRKSRASRGSEDEAAIGIQQCKECFGIFRSGVDTCPTCGAPVILLPPKELTIKEGQLEKINLERERTNRRQEQGRSSGMKELVELGVRRGMKKPGEWAVFVLASRKNRKPTAEEFAEVREVLAEVQGVANGW